jgi:hypothetical protein
LPVTPAPQLVIGFAEYVDIPEWHITRLRAKVDTGARSSALHVENIRELAGGRVRFEVRLHRRHHDRRVVVEALVTRRARVKPSNGMVHWRYFVTAHVRIGPVVEPIEMSLVDRQHMIFRMLIGRSALAHRFLVDVAKRYVLSKHPKRAPKRKRKHKEAASSP